MEKTEKNQFTGFLVSNASTICSFILSHPLYFSYLIFFSPYIFNLLSFLSPLFIPMSLIIFTLSPPLFHRPEFKLDEEEILENDVNRREGDDGIYWYGEIEAFRTLFESSVYELDESPVEELKYTVFEDVKCDFEEDPVEIICSGSNVSVMDETFVEEIVKEVDDDYKKVNDNVEEKEEIKSRFNPEKEQFMSSYKIFSRVTTSGDADEFNWRTREDISNVSSKRNENMGSYGSMRQDKEWKRTLACKLYEERNNVDGGEEGMDSLWETHDTDSTKVQPEKKKKNTNNKDNDYENDEDGVAVQLCCLQALNLSAGKMNMGMKRPNLMRFSKAFKGLGWMHKASSSSSSRSRRQGRL